MKQLIKARFCLTTSLKRKREVIKVTVIPLAINATDIPYRKLQQLYYALALRSA